MGRSAFHDGVSALPRGNRERKTCEPRNATRPPCFWASARPSPGDRRESPVPPHGMISVLRPFERGPHTRLSVSLCRHVMDRLMVTPVHVWRLCAVIAIAERVPQTRSHAQDDDYVLKV